MSRAIPSVKFGAIIKKPKQNKTKTPWFLCHVAWCEVPAGDPSLVGREELYQHHGFLQATAPSAGAVWDAGTARTCLRKTKQTLENGHRQVEACNCNWRCPNTVSTPGTFKKAQTPIPCGLFHCALCWASRNSTRAWAWCFALGGHPQPECCDLSCCMQERDFLCEVSLSLNTAKCQP